MEEVGKVCLSASVEIRIVASGLDILVGRIDFVLGLVNAMHSLRKVF